MIEKEPIICIIDDSKEDRETFRRYLLQDTAYRYHLFEEETGEKGLEMCRRIQPDCILLDYNLPDIDGLVFLSKLADEAPTVSIPVVMLTGLSSEAIALQAMKSGAQDYLVKGEMTAGNLYRAIHNAIERNMMRHIVEEQRRDLEQKNQELQAFAYALAHDLKAPLRAIRGFAQIVVDEHSSALDVEGRHYMETVVKAGAQMNVLIDDLLSYAQIEHHRVQRQQVALNPLMKKVVDSFETRIAQTGATITIHNNFPAAYGDTTLITQTLVNLLDNALKYHRPGSKPLVTISYETDGSTITVCIADNGIGIAAKHHERIFNIFQRLHGDDEYQGTGIGLAIVKKAVELMYGQIWLESSEGKGTRFYVKLPLYAKHYA